MLTSLLLSCLLVPSASLDGDAVAAVPVAPPLAPRDAAGASELVTVVYDLERVWTAPSNEPRSHEQQYLRELPFRFGYDEEVPYADDIDTDFPIDELMSMLWRVVAPGEFEYEGRQMVPSGEHGLRITAPASVQADVRATLDFLAASLQRRARLDIDIWRTSGELELGEVPDAASLDAAQLAGRLVRLAGRHEELLLGRTERRDALNSISFLRDWEPEIAQHAAIAQPEFDRMDLGTSLLLRLEEQEGGRCTLRFAARLSELRSLEPRTDAVRSSVNGDAGTSSLAIVAGALDQPAVSFATMAGSRVLAPGDSVVTLARAVTLDGPVGYVVRYTLQSVDPAPAPLVLAGDSPRTVRTLDVSPALWPMLGASALTPGNCLATIRDPESEQRTWLSFPAEERGSLDGLVERAGDLLGVETDEVAPWQLGSHLVLGGKSAEADALRGAMVSALPLRRTMNLELALVETGRATGTGRAVARAIMPLSTGDRCLAVVGSARMLLVGFDVDVAEGASIPDPNVGGCLDGLALRARASADGSVALDLLSHRVMHRERVDLHVPNLMPVDRVDISVVTLAPQLVADGAWHSQPDIADGAGGVQLELRWRLTAP